MPSTWPRVTPTWRSMPNSRARASVCAEKVAATPDRPMTMAIASSR
jgi:hypothetical protein